jgi:hypothetical protein
VAQHEDLELLAIGQAAEQAQELEDLAKSEVQKREHASPPVGWQRRRKLADQRWTTRSQLCTLADRVYAPYVQRVD